MLESYGIKLHSTTVKNPQVNAFIECLHGLLGNQLHCIIFQGDNFLKDIDAVVQACAYVTRTTVPSNIPYSPLQMAFGVDMLFCQKVAIDWEHIKQLRQQQAIENNNKENKIRLHHVYQVRDLVLIITPTLELHNQAKLLWPTEGSYEISRVYINRSVHLICRYFDEFISIQQL